MEQILNKRATKRGAKTYEVKSIHPGYRDLFVFYPQTIDDPFYEGDIVAIDRLDKKGLFVTTYPYKDEAERERMLKGILGGSIVLGEVIL